MLLATPPSIVVSPVRLPAKPNEIPSVSIDITFSADNKRDYRRTLLALDDAFKGAMHVVRSGAWSVGWLDAHRSLRNPFTVTGGWSAHVFADPTVIEAAVQRFLPEAQEIVDAATARS